MNSRAYNATFAGQPVDRAAVEAYYMDLMNAYPEGSIERDNLRAELIDFHNKAINAEINAYAAAYKEGGYAFGTKVELTQYLAFLRDAKAASTSEDDKSKYNLEEFLVTFNDIHDDMKASSAGAGALASFYRRELSRAVEMGITKDSDSYRTIENYLASAAKASAEDGRRQAAQDAADAVGSRMTTAATAIAASLRAAVSAGRITAQDMVAIIGDGTGNGIVSRFASIDLSIKQRVLSEGERAGVQLDGQMFNAETFVSYVDDTRTFLKSLIGSGNVDATSKSAYRALLGAFDAEVSGPVGLMTDLAAADDSALDMIIDNERGLGNPVINVEAYKNHAATIGGSGASAVAGQAMLMILNGQIPDPSKFGGRTELWQLNPAEQERLAESYTGNAYIASGGLQDPKEFILTVMQDYTASHSVSTGAGFVTATIDAAGNPAVVVTDQPSVGGTPFVYSVKMSNGTVVPVVGRQKSQVVLASDGSPLGKVIFDIDSNGLAKKSFITFDGYKMDMDAFERWTGGNDIRLAVDADGNIQANINASDPQMSQYFMGTYIKNDASFGGYVSKDVWNGVSYGTNPGAALKILGSKIGDDLLPGSSSILAIGADGNITVTDPEAAFKRYGIYAEDLEAVVNANDPGSDYNAAKTAIQDRLFRISERNSNYVAPGEKDPAIIGMEAAAANQAKRLREENAARLLREREATGNTGFDPITAIQALLGIGAERGSAEIALEKMRADAARKEAERRAIEVEDYGNRGDETSADQALIDLGWDSGTSGSTLPTTINKDPVASFFLRNMEITNPEVTRVSGPASLDTTKIGSAPVISTIDFRPSVKTTPTPVGPIRTRLGVDPVKL
jgi:hypothetical protein